MKDTIIEVKNKEVSEPTQELWYDYYLHAQMEDYLKKRRENSMREDILF